MPKRAVASESDDKSAHTRKWSVLRFVISAIITALLTVAAGYLTYRLTTREPKLVYDLGQGPALSSLGLTRRIYVLRIRNTGRKEVEQFFTAITLSRGRLDDVAVSRSTGLQVAELRDSGAYEVRAPFLNPSDTISVSFLASAPDSGRPNVVVRGRGVVGKRQEQSDAKKDKSLFSALLAAAGASLASMTLLASIWSSRRRRALPGLAIVDSEKRGVIVAYILARAGLQDLSDKARYQQRDLMYREVADELLLLAQREPDHLPKAVAALAALLLVPWVGEGSREIILRAMRLLHAPASTLDTAPLKTSISASELRDRVDALIGSILTPPAPTPRIS